MPMMNVPAELLAQFGIPQAGPAQGTAPNAPPMVDQRTGRPAPRPAIAMGQGGVNLNPGTPSVAAPPMTPPISPAVPPMPRGGVFGPGPAAPPMKSSDDPGITGMPALPTPPDISKNPVGPISAQYQADLAKRAAFGLGPQKADYKPSGWRKFGGNLLGAIAAGGLGFAGNRDAGAIGAKTVDSVVNKRFNEAQGEWTRNTSALDKQLEAERGGFGIAESAGKVPQEDFTNKMGVARERREQQEGQGKIDSAEARAARLQDMIDNPKTTAPKNADEALAQAYLESDPQKRSQLMEMATALHKQEIERSRESRPPKEAKSTTNTAVATENRKAQALSRAKRQYDKDTQAAGNDPELRKQADDAFKEAQQDAQDAYEAEIAAGGGSPQHSDWPSGKKPAASVQSSQPESAKGTPQVGDVKMVRGKQMKITKLYKDGSFDADPVK